MGVARALTDGRDKGGIKRVLAESEEQARLPDPAVPDQQQFEQVIVRLRHLHTFLPENRSHSRPAGTARTNRMLRLGTLAVMSPFLPPMGQ